VASYQEEGLGVEYRISREDLLQRAFGDGVSARLFNGAEHGLSDISLMLGEVQPGSHVGLHRHEYEELFIIHQGQADFTIGDDTISVSAGDIVVIPAGAPHRFVNTGQDKLRQTAVHGAKEIAIEWLE